MTNTEFARHLDFYQDEYWFMVFSDLEELWGNRDKAKLYLEKYWLKEAEYLNTWEPIQNKLFDTDTFLPQNIFRSEFDYSIINGGALFIEEIFDCMLSFLKRINEEYFVVIQHETSSEEPTFKMKYPVELSYREVMSGNYISAVLGEMSYNNYYVFGASGEWGLYVANDYEASIHIYGVSKSVRKDFVEEFRALIIEDQALANSITPIAYKNSLLKI